MHISGSNTNWSVPPLEELQKVKSFLKPWEMVTSPYFSGLENISSEQAYLFVGNHTLLGVLDAPLMFLRLFEEKNIYLRGLGDHLHFKIPLWRDFLSKYGVMDGNRDNCDFLMQNNQSILVFPGGAREVAKRKGEKYQLMWKNRLGFARMAIRNKFPIMPFSAVGAEESFEILLDGNELLQTPIGTYIEKLGIKEDLLFPLIKGMGPTLIPYPARYYFHFSEPIPTEQYDGDENNEEYLWEVRTKVETAVEEGIQKMLQKRDSDPNRDFKTRVKKFLKNKISDLSNS